MKLFFSYFGASIAAVVFVLVLAGVRYAHAAETGACYNIADSDARTYCLARAHREPSMCYSIKSADMRSMCLAEVRK